MPDRMRIHNFRTNLGTARSYNEIYDKLWNINKNTNGQLKTWIDHWKNNKQHDPQSFDPSKFTTDGERGKQEQYQYIVYLWTFSGTLKQWQQHYATMRKDNNVRVSVKQAVKRFIDAAKTKNKHADEVLFYYYAGETTRGFGVRTPEHLVALGQHGGSPNFSALSATVRMYGKKTGISYYGQVVYAIEPENVHAGGGIDPKCQDDIKFMEPVVATLFGEYCINMADCGWWWKGEASHWRLWHLIGRFSVKGATEKGPRVWEHVLWRAVVHNDPFLNDIVDSMDLGANATVEAVWFAMHSYAGQAAQAVFKKGMFLLVVLVVMLMLMMFVCY